MKKYLLLFVIAIFVMSCSKKVEVKGKIAGSSPLERIEFVEASGVATLPLINIGLDKDGNFTGNFEAPKDGMYLMNYAGKSNLIFLKGGQNIQISGNSATFPNEFTLTGDGKADNEFYQACQKYLMSYAQTLDIQAITNEKLPFFLKEIKKIESDLNKNVEENTKKFNPLTMFYSRLFGCDYAAIGYQSGIFPCLRHGLSSFLSFSMARLRQMRLRVSCGWITSSI